ncbi:MAG: hypothetical protein J3R72DRAFT_444280 [Linnemannia gamsii]|nr:MAG: hypothetical protein J3R72DRAFT_444280 [Linnemannia gamsii]
MSRRWSLPQLQRSLLLVLPEAVLSPSPPNVPPRHVPHEYRYHCAGPLHPLLSPLPPLSRQQCPTGYAPKPEAFQLLIPLLRLCDRFQVLDQCNRMSPLSQSQPSQ